MTRSVDPWIWAVFIVAVAAMLAADVLLIHRDAERVTLRSAALWTAFWVAVASVFGGIVYLWHGADAAGEYFTGYLIEKTLSVDNIFVFVFIFSYFSIPAKYQYRVLFFGVLGAIVMRGVFIAVGVALLDRFEWMLFVFGAFLVFTGVEMFRHQETHLHPDENPLLRLVRRWLPTTDEMHGQHFFVRQRGRLVATPLFVVLVLIESTDVVFALDSIPAIFAVTRNPFIVFTSNVFAILGLRALYFLVAGLIGRFAYLRPGLAILLTLIGVKMIASELVAIPIWVTFASVVAIVGGAMLLSLLAPPSARPEEQIAVPDPLHILTRRRERPRRERAAAR